MNTTRLFCHRTRVALFSPRSSKIPFSDIKQPFKIDWREYSDTVDDYKAEFAKIMKLEDKADSDSKK